MPTPRTRCDTHSAAPAGWRCAACELRLCVRCVAPARAQTVQYAACTRCGTLAEPLRVLRSEQPYSERLRSVWRYPLSGAGLTTLALSGLVLWVLSYAGHYGLVLGPGLLWSYVFTLIRRTSLGDDSLDPPDFSGMADLLNPALRGLVASAVVWGPALLFVLLAGPPKTTGDVLLAAAPDVQGELRLPERVDVDSVLDREVARVRESSAAALAHRGALEAAGLEGGSRPAPAAHVDPHAAPRPTHALREGLAPGPELQQALGSVGFWLLLLLGLLWLPAAVLYAAAGVPLVQVLNPLQALLLARRISHDYALAAGMALLLAPLGVALWAAGVAAGTVVPVLGSWLGASLTAYVPLAAGRSLGLLLYVRGAELGFLRPEDAFEPAPTVGEPQGTLSEAVRTPEHVQQRRAAVAAHVEAPPVPAAPVAPRAPAAPRVMGAAGLEAAPAWAPAALAPEEHAAQAPALHPATEALRAAVDAQALESALQLYPAAVQAGGVAASCHLAVGRHAASQGQYPLAVQALRAACAAEPAGPHAATSLVLLARVLGERLGDAAGAQRVYAHVLQHYPDSEGARFARGRLTPAGS